MFKEEIGEEVDQRWSLMVWLGRSKEQDVTNTTVDDLHKCEKKLLEITNSSQLSLQTMMVATLSDQPDHFVRDPIRRLSTSSAELGLKLVTRGFD